MEPAANTLTEFPPAIPFGDLMKPHADYKPEKIRKHCDLYEGGDAFQANIENYLVKRQIEETAGTVYATRDPLSASGEQGQNFATEGNTGGASQWEARKKRAWYKPIVAGIIDFIGAAMFQSEPAIIAASGTTAKPSLVEKVMAGLRSIFGRSTGAPTDYWNNLNRDADGTGTDLSAILREAALETMLHRRAYLGIRFPEKIDRNGATLAQQEAAGEFNAQIFLLRARDVDDWEFDERGNLKMVRIHRVTEGRSVPYKQPDLEVHIWTYVTARGLYVYRRSWAKADVNQRPKDSDLIAMDAGGPQAHELGTLPVVPIIIPKGLWVMERLAATVIELFNRQASLTWFLDMMAFAMLVFYTAKDLSQIVVKDLSAIQLQPNDKCEVKAPDAAIATQLLADSDRLKEEMFLELQAMVLIAAAKDEQGRQSGVAKQRDFGSLSTLLGALAAPLRDALERVVRSIETLRKKKGLDQGLVLAVQGLDKFDVQHLEQKLKNAASFLSLEGAPEAAKDWTVLDVALAITANAPPEIREKVVQQMLNKPAAPELPAPAPGVAPPELVSTGGGQVDIDRVPLAVQQLALARERANTAGDKDLAKQLGDKMDELLKRI